jgi:hypothetical protein
MRGSTLSRTLATSLCDIALGLGMRPTARLCAPKDNLHPWRSRPFYEIELVTPFEHPDNADRADEGQEKGRGVNSAHVWAQVRGVEQYRFAGTVHSLDVDGEESYVAEGIGVRFSASRGVLVAQAS